jgi:hypothetical protein
VQIRVGQLRRWLDPDDERDTGKVFMILGEKTEWDCTAPTLDACWDFIMDGVKEWHYDDVIRAGSEVISAG